MGRPLERKYDLTKTASAAKNAGMMRNSQLMMSSELKLVPMWPDHAPAIM